MRGAFLATAAAIAGTAMADIAHMRRHGHDSFHQRRAVEQPAPEADATCGCTTEVVTSWGPPTLIPIATSSPSSTVTSEVVTTLHSTSYSTVTLVVTPSGASPNRESAPATPAVTLPTPGVTSFSTTGTYTIPATTLTVTHSTTVCGATTTELPSGTHTYGGVTTVVDRHTTVVCPYATVEPSGSTVTSVIRTTTYVCPSAGTYTIAPTTTYVPTSTVIVYPTPATITPGTYTQPAQTITVTRDNYIYVCPFTGQQLPTTAPVAPATTAVPATTTAVPATTTAVPATSSVAPSSSPSKPAAPSGAVSGQMGMTYSPYTNEGGCKDKASIISEVALLKSKGFTHVRVYSTDCGSLEFIGEAARTSGLRMIIGVFIKQSGVAGAQDQVTAISKWAQWDLVSLIVVGNESIQNHFCDASTLAGFIVSAKQSFKAAGYSGQVTTTEPINVWQANGDALCGAVDIIGANIHPFFNADVSAAEAGKFVAQEFKTLKGICPGKDVINLETGWPHSGEANGKAIPSREEQAIAIKAIADEVGSMSVFFSYFDDLWKQPGAFGVERYWGCIENF
ncbi:putative cell wall glucanase (Scw11) [Aspergillus clavatus NRRL 1]|uniref:Probable beta-glucosidase btgE n=1 Tax=Aspergillus clavatus (strain ATCC 1007 / CBS 513.65 / DSM 816 / NCTC 3887 / NRRL 1 / QM 1276 / 107) TaxID=344612 RepID=BTGE_ASPCL|nr:cell wall glucanase (Scw11), putative [Aspergillus clavatus NRRL 1]A1C499.1 RecName: Full=Probable beta-glucosidase btgE; AltName: Full=Beta-D-glucoside glucohydrolase btgE; AltName: Full=Cellobiase btgE; AltName: Full=Gentiobiase btgE; Flags: Precursor [Aspergillus clavatus NRRL 1]EAW15239.1 cell wall glucanase (Scw11), putative [Aspergillus clavatus NRRL 1]